MRHTRRYKVTILQWVPEYYSGEWEAYNKDDALEYALHAHDLGLVALTGSGRPRIERTHITVERIRQLPLPPTDEIVAARVLELLEAHGPHDEGGSPSGDPLSD